MEVPQGTMRPNWDVVARARVIIVAALALGVSAGTAVAQAPPTATFAVDSFQHDLFTGSATAAIPISVSPGAATIAPRISLRYNSGTVDELGPHDQGQSSGLGWTLDVGGFVIRDTKATQSTSDDTFRLVFQGRAHTLILVDATQSLYRTQNEYFWKIQHTGQGDHWTLTTKDGTLHRFGFNTDSKAIGLAPDLVTPVTYKYLLDEIITPSGTAVRYSYTKQTGTAAISGRTYDQAVYPNTITYAYHNGALVGPAREVRFVRGARQDWTDSTATTGVSFFERERIDSIEVRVGGDLVRKYILGFDYSIDRDTTHTWGGGATGDLTLRSITQYGSDGASSLQPVSFTYNNARLSTAANGIGGTVSYSYDRVNTAPLYNTQLNNWDEGGIVCLEYYPATSPNPAGCDASLVGHILSRPLPGTVPLYATQLNNWDEGGASCFDYHPATSPNGNCFNSSLLGYIRSSSVPATVPLYNTQRNNWDEGGAVCFDYHPATSPNGNCFSSSLIGYIYVRAFDRYRVISRSASDGRGRRQRQRSAITASISAAMGRNSEVIPWCALPIRPGTTPIPGSDKMTRRRGGRTKRRLGETTAR